MIKIGDTILRNLEEQVLENKEQIALHWNVDRVLADFGIKVRGTLPTKEALDQIPTDQLQYGDAYFIGTAEPFDVWIWTRADVNAGKDEDYWLNIGHIAIEGPQGPQGPEGPQGERGERGATWYTGSAVDTSNLKDGDLWLYTGAPADSGYIYKWSATNMRWTNIANIRGPQGIQGPTGPQGPAGPEGPTGPQGERGEAGGFVTIKSILSSTDLLPNPAELNDPTAAFLVGTASNYNLYVQVGESASTRTWHNAGPFNAATAVTVNGEYQATWDADTKVDKATTARGIYGTNGIIYVNSIEPGSYSIARFSNEGRLKTNDPDADNDCVNKKYAANNYVPVPALSGPGRYRLTAMGKNSAGDLLTSSIDVVNYGSTPTNSAIIRANDNGNITIANPVNATDATTKNYVDNNFVKVPSNGSGIILRFADGSTTGVEAANYGVYTPYAIPRYSSTGTLAVNNPVNTTDVANKQYVDSQSIKPATPAVKSVVTIGTDGAISTLQYAESDIVNTLPIRKANGCIACRTGTQYNEATNKGYVDSLIRKPVTIYLNLGSGGDATIAAGVLGISAQLTPAEITALKAGIASDAEDMTPRVTALFDYLDNNNYTMDYLALPVNGQIATTNNSYYLSGGIHRSGTTTLKIRSGFGSEQQEPQYLEFSQGNIARVRLIVHIPNDPDDETP